MRFCIFISSAILFSASLLKGQTPVVKIESGARKIEVLKAIALGDSIFLSYSENFGDPNVSYRTGSWVTMDGQRIVEKNSLLHAENLWAISKSGNDHFYYFLKTKEADLDLTIYRNIEQDGEKDSSNKKVVNLPGNLVGTHADGSTLLLVTYPPSSTHLNITLVSGAEILASHKINIPVSFKTILKKSSDVIGRNTFSDILTGSCKVKMFWDSDRFLLVMDNQHDGDESGTEVLSLDLKIGMQQSFQFPTLAREKFSSYYFEHRLYRFIESRKGNSDRFIFGFDAHDLQDGKKLFRKNINKDSTRKEKVFLRLGNSLIVRKTLFQDFISAPLSDAAPSLIVERSNSGELQIVLSQFLDKRQGVVAAEHPLIALGIFLISHTLVNLIDPPGDSWSCSWQETRPNHFELSRDNSSSIRQTIDEYEFSRTGGNKDSKTRWDRFLRQKGYVRVQNGAAGVYVEKHKGNSRIVVIKY